jgi:hypothetical protein
MLRREAAWESNRTGTSPSAWSIRPTSAGEEAWIFLGEVFQVLPVAILQAL